MKSKPVINVVLASCQPKLEVKFNRWSDEIHIPMLLKFKGMTKVTRYKLLRKTNEKPTYLAIYEFEDQKAWEEYENSPELADARKEAAETWKEDKFETISRVQYEALKTWMK